MNRLVTFPVPAVSDCPVPWRELVPLFLKCFPRTIQDAMDNDKRARVHFCGTPFDIIPEITPGFPPAFCVWGPAHLNQFPDSI